jgi:DNA polymerase-3 subunit delta
MPPDLKPAYLIHGDDHGRIAERRAGLRRLAERESGAAGIELLDGENATPEGAGYALAAMSLSLGRRFIIVDGCERWKDAEVEEHLAPLLSSPPPDTTIAFFAREEGRAKAPAKLHAAVKAAGGDISEEGTVKPWELPAWVRSQGAKLGIELDAAAAKALVAQVGERQQRLARELEKLALEASPGERVDAEQVSERAAGGAEWRLWSIADATLARDGAAVTRLYLRLRSQGERMEGMLFWIVRRLRDAHAAALALEAGEAAAQVRRGLKMPPKAAERFLADVRRWEVDGLERALGRLSDLELAARGGSLLEPDTLALRTLAEIAAD